MSTWQTICHAVAGDFADIPDAAQATRIVLRLVLAAVLGGMIGFEREHHRKAAGLRTLMLVSLGAALFVLVMQQSGGTSADVSRVIQGIVAGVGFLGIGTILNNPRQENVKGLTTAASIWLTAAIGVTAGLGREFTAILVTLLALVILAVLPRFEHWCFKPNGNNSHASPPSGTPHEPR